MTLLLTLAALVVAGSIVTSQLALAHSGKRARPRLALTSRNPMTVRGSGFKPGVRVRLTLNAGQSVTRHTRASAQGSFTTRFGTVVLDSCTAFSVSAVVNHQVVAVLRPAKPECAPASTP
jgi:hypothetical protein